ncbi:galectin-1-like isoform X2 [Aquarana catesbeiana]|uniref:galectin-1-like isoform X2 n=1 Tax=Aquarana catesbeiana TaxID=8400 RepID=UPI003CC9E5A7
MADKTFCSIRPGCCVEVEGFIPHACKLFAINLGKDSKNYVIHFSARFDDHGDKSTIVLNTRKDGAWGAEQKENFFPFQEGSDTKVSFTFQPGRISIQLPFGNPLSFPVRLPIEQISFVSVKHLQLKSIIVK